MKIFSIINNKRFLLNNDILNKIYSPIIGEEFIDIYRKLYSLTSDSVAKTAIELLNSFGVNMEKFKKCKKILMAFNLIEKRIDKHDANTCFLVLQEPLSFNEFISSEKRRKILVEKIGNEKYEEISYFFNNTNYLVTSEAVAEVGIDDIFGEITKNEGNININDLYAEVCKKVHNFTNFSEECKKMIINHSSDNLNFTINNYLPIVIESIVEKDNKKILSEFLLKRKLSIKDDAQIDLKKTIKKNQSEENFAISILKDGFGEDKIYEEYKAEQFFFKLLGDINEETANFFKTCREKYSLSDGIINLIINYVVINNKNFFGNQWNTKYANTIATSFHKNPLLHEIKAAKIHLEKAINSKKARKS